MTFDDIIYFRVVINDTNNAVLLGDTISFCKDKCSFPQVKGRLILYIYIYIYFFFSPLK